jgi:hypothetical protein
VAAFVPAELARVDALLDDYRFFAPFRAYFDATFQVVDNDDGVIVGHTIEPGNPADPPQLAAAIARITRRAGGLHRRSPRNSAGGA